VNTPASSPKASSSTQVPPPPWSRWSTMATPTLPLPPTTQRREIELLHTTPPPSRKRKLGEDDQPVAELAPLDHAPPSPKRRALPPPSPPRSVQTLSPSLALIMSPVNQSPRASYAARNGNDRLDVPGPPSGRTGYDGPSLPMRNGHDGPNSTPSTRIVYEASSSVPVRNGYNSPGSSSVRNGYDPVASAARNGYDTSSPRSGLDGPINVSIRHGRDTPSSSSRHGVESLLMRPVDTANASTMTRLDTPINLSTRVHDSPGSSSARNGRDSPGLSKRSGPDVPNLLTRNGHDSPGSRIGQRNGNDVSPPTSMRGAKLLM